MAQSDSSLKFLESYGILEGSDDTELPERALDLHVDLNTPEPRKSGDGDARQISPHCELPGLGDIPASPYGTSLGQQGASLTADIASSGPASETSADSGSKEKRRRQKLPEKDKLVCAVCGDKASGYNFGAMTCESCKAFFRRNALKGAAKQFLCGFENDCKIDPFTRKFCTFCRLQKCISLGMKKEWILDEEALKKRKKVTKRVKEPQASGDQHSRKGVDGKDLLPEPKEQLPEPLSLADETEIKEILENYKAIDMGPVEETQQRDLNDRTYLAATEEFSSLSDQHTQATQMMNMMQGFLSRFIPFIKTLHGYYALDLTDRITTLKQCITETMVLRSAIQYDPNIGGFSVRDTISCETKSMQMHFIKDVFGEELYQEHMKFITTFNTAAKWDKPTMILTMIINLFGSDRPGLQDKRKVVAAEEKYSHLLRAYLGSKYSQTEANAIYPKLLIKLTDVRSYGEMSKEAINQKSVHQSTDLEPLLRAVLTDD